METATPAPIDPSTTIDHHERPIGAAIRVLALLGAAVGLAFSVLKLNSVVGGGAISNAPPSMKPGLYLNLLLYLGETLGVAVAAWFVLRRERVRSFALYCVCAACLVAQVFHLAWLFHRSAAPVGFVALLFYVPMALALRPGERTLAADEDAS